MSKHDKYALFEIREADVTALRSSKKLRLSFANINLGLSRLIPHASHDAFEGFIFSQTTFVKVQTEPILKQ